jgi:hypothetical protein
MLHGCVKRRLVPTFAADFANYSRLIGNHEGGTDARFYSAPPAVRAKLASDVVHAEGFAALMTVLREFIDEIASELDARNDKPLAPHHWIGFVKLLGDIDLDDKMGELRRQMEQIVSRRDVRFQDRCLALIPLLSADPAIAAEFTARRRTAITALAAL